MSVDPVSWRSDGRLVRRCGRSGLHLPTLGLALGAASLGAGRRLHDMVSHAVELGVGHFDVTVPSASRREAEVALGGELGRWRAWRDELVISVRLGLGSGPLPLRGFASRKQILSGLDGVLQRTGLEYVDVLYAHRWERGASLEECAGALADAVRRGKALYAGLSSMPVGITGRMLDLLEQAGVPAAVVQGSYALTDRGVEEGLLRLLAERGVGFVACAPLAHGDLSGVRQPGWTVADEMVAGRVDAVAASRGQSSAQLALGWVLQRPGVASALIGTTDPAHLAACCGALYAQPFTTSELAALEACCPGPVRRRRTARPRATVGSL
ncbi:aldo/keto reductase [Streptomyces sp. NPDC001941]|uniref:aldo/keto reductase n=1 Tax=Streptomyces sp. NPDC001941 TaxID=3154659 RepID=UPI00332B050F